jgi:hypothetical protein
MKSYRYLEDLILDDAEKKRTKGIKYGELRFVPKNAWGSVIVFDDFYEDMGELTKVDVLKDWMIALENEYNKEREKFYSSIRKSKSGHVRVSKKVKNRAVCDKVTV